MATKRALIVAINDYGSPQNNLPSCLEDAGQFRSLLNERYRFESFKELYDSDATVSNMEAELVWLFKDVSPDDRLVFFYSGHGFQQRKGEDLEECLVLSDLKFLSDDRICELSQAVPPGVLTVVLDSCFSGGMEKRVAVDGRVEIARTKLWVPPVRSGQEQKVLIGEVFVPRPFGCRQVNNPVAVKQLVLGPVQFASDKEAAEAPDMARLSSGEQDEASQLRLNGLLLSACSENETASASTSMTEGMSAFTYALIQALGIGGEPSAAELHERARKTLKELGFRQTPLLRMPPKPTDIGSLSFVTLARSSGSSIPAQPTPPPPRRVCRSGSSRQIPRAHPRPP